MSTKEKSQFDKYIREVRKGLLRQLGVELDFDDLDDLVDSERASFSSSISRYDNDYSLSSRSKSKIDDQFTFSSSLDAFDFPKNIVCGDVSKYIVKNDKF